MAVFCTHCGSEITEQRADDPWFHTETGEERCEELEEFASPPAFESTPGWGDEPREKGSTMNTDYAKSLAQNYGSRWFDDSSMRFFNSRICESTWTRIVDTETKKVYRFVSSEKYGPDYDRWYTVREFRLEPDLCARLGVTVTIRTVGEFQQYRTARTALAHIRDGEVTD